MIGRRGNDNNIKSSSKRPLQEEPIQNQKHPSRADLHVIRIVHQRYRVSSPSTRTRSSDPALHTRPGSAPALHSGIAPCPTPNNSARSGGSPAWDWRIGSREGRSNASVEVGALPAPLRLFLKPTKKRFCPAFQWEGLLGRREHLLLRARGASGVRRASLLPDLFFFPDLLSEDRPPLDGVSLPDLQGEDIKRPVFHWLLSLTCGRPPPF